MLTLGSKAGPATVVLKSLLDVLPPHSYYTPDTVTRNAVGVLQKIVGLRTP